MRRNIIIISSIIALVATGALAATTIPDSDDRASNATVDEKTSGAKGAETAKVKPVNVKTAIVKKSSLTETVSATGVTAAKTDVTFSAEIPGRIEYLGPRLGDRVRKGQVLARIDYQTLKAQKTQASANYALAKTTYDRFDELGSDLVSRQKLDEARSALTGARAQFAIAREAVEKSVVRSTLTGQVSEKLVERAEYVGPGTPLYRIVDYRTIIIEAQLPETQVALISKGIDVKVAIPALDTTYDGKVETVLPAADPVSKTFTVRVAVKNPDLKILVGMSASLEFSAKAHRDVVVVTQDVIVEGRDGRSVFVDEGGKAARRMVELGATEGDRVVVLEGLKANEALIVVGHRDLTDGRPVRVVR